MSGQNSQTLPIFVARVANMQPLFQLLEEIALKLN